MFVGIFRDSCEIIWRNRFEITSLLKGLRPEAITIIINMYMDKKKLEKKDSTKKVQVQEQDNIGAFFQTCKVNTETEITAIYGVLRVAWKGFHWRLNI